MKATFLSRRTRTLVVLLACRSLGAASAVAQGSSVLACVESGEAGPAVGMYSLLHDNDHTMCVAPKTDSDGSIVPCLRIGRVYVGQARTDVENVLGLAPRILPQRLPTLAAHAYAVSGGDSASRRATYYVVEYERVGELELVFSAQLTGDHRDSLRASFSCLRLGVEEAAVRRQLGPPSEVSPFEAPEARVAGVVWSYELLPISIEIVDEKVYSFRVWRPDHVPVRERTLTLLKRP